MPSSAPPKIIKFQTSDNQVFEVEESVIALPQAMKNIIEEDAEATIPLPNITARVMSKVVEYCMKNHEENSWKREKQYSWTYCDSPLMKMWEDEFVHGFTHDKQMLLDVVLAADYLQISGLLDLTCKSVAYTLKRKTPEEIRKLFNIKNDFTKEEEEKVRKENAWAFE